MNATGAISNIPLSICCASASIRSPRATKTPTMPLSCATIRLCAQWWAGVNCRWLPSRLCRGWKMPSLGNRCAHWSAWAWSGSCAVERKGGRADKRSFWTSIRLPIRPTAKQQLSFFNGHYDTYMYHPLLIFEGESGILLASTLRAGDVGGTRGLLPRLRPLVTQLRRRWPRRPIALRADGEFAKPTLLDYAEYASCLYAIGLPRNPKLEARVQRLCRRAQQQWQQSGQAVRLYSDFFYKAGTWPHPRRVAVKCEVTALGPNLRFVVTNRVGTPEQIFAWYNQRGQAENYIKELKNDLAADRLSCSAYRANAFRLQLPTCWCSSAACCCTAPNWPLPPWHKCGCACSSSGPACIARSAACGSISPAAGPDDHYLRSCSHAWARSARRPENLTNRSPARSKYSLQNLVAPVCCRRNILLPKIGPKRLALHSHPFPPPTS